MQGNLTVLILSYYDAFPFSQGTPADDILCAKLKVETRGRMQGLHCALTSANCLGEELAKGCYLLQTFISSEGALYVMMTYDIDRYTATF